MPGAGGDVEHHGTDQATDGKAGCGGAAEEGCAEANRNGQGDPVLTGGSHQLPVGSPPSPDHPSLRIPQLRESTRLVNPPFEGGIKNPAIADGVNDLSEDHLRLALVIEDSRPKAIASSLSSLAINSLFSSRIALFSSRI